MKAKQIDINWTPELSVYASEDFLKTVGDEYGWIGGFDTSGKLRCILPYTIVRKFIFRMVRFRVETIMVGEEITIDEEKQFLNSAIDYLRSIGADMIIPATTNSIFRTYPDGAKAAPYGTYIINLTEPTETLWGKLNASHRRKVRLAKKNSVEILSGIEHLETSYTLVRDTFKRSELPFMSLDSFKKMILGLGENVRIYVAKHNGITQGAIVVPFSKQTAYYVYGGSIPKPVTGAMNLLHWNAIEEFREYGTRQYDFVGVRIDPEKGSKQEGLLMYKQRFGGKLLQGYMWKYSFSTLKFAAYSLAVRHLRGGDIVDNEGFKLHSSSR